MKTVLVLVSLVVLSSLSIYAQRDNMAETLLASDVHTDPPATPDRENSLSEFLDQQLRNSSLWTDQQELNASLAEADPLVRHWSNTVEENKTSYESPYIPMLLEEMDHHADFHQQLLAKKVLEPAHQPTLENLHGVTNSDFLKGGGLKWVIVE